MNYLARRVSVCAALLVTGLAGSAVASAQTSALTLEAAVARALVTNPTIAAARLQRPVDAAALDVAAERPNPDLAFEWSKETPRQSIGATVPIELGGKRQRRMEVATAGIAIGEADVARLINDIRNDVRRAYFTTVAANRRVQIADDVCVLAQRARDAAAARVLAGDVPESDLTQAELALASAESNGVAARGEAAAAWEELLALMGGPVDAPAVLADSLTSGAVPSVVEATRLADEANTEVRTIDARLVEQAALINLANALRVPDITPGATFTYGAQPEFRVGWRMSVGVTLPVFTRHHAAVTLEQATMARLRAEHDAAVARISGTVRAAVARAASAREQATRYETTIMPLALETERQAQAAYDGGQIGLPALIQALQIARESRERGLQVGLELQLALADLERAVGAPIR